MSYHSRAFALAYNSYLFQKRDECECQPRHGSLLPFITQCNPTVVVLHNSNACRAAPSSSDLDVDSPDATLEKGIPFQCRVSWRDSTPFI
ncbi:hypothetical protein AV530_014934 [Patagioenas fasciata monilis]|uniref:Uncharacterized protein n=1 Tax=Patagioenas fasciata monilis TaxID=372326 RepID=A0A1V4K0C0_PATFA|nr:hypothetical protein AV530_014934 [Patagioenas fasciata monilis]